MRRGRGREAGEWHANVSDLLASYGTPVAYGISCFTSRVGGPPEMPSG
jgi:hypothetical protein